MCRLGGCLVGYLPTFIEPPGAVQARKCGQAVAQHYRARRPTWQGQELKYSAHQAGAAAHVNQLLPSDAPEGF